MAKVFGFLAGIGIALNGWAQMPNEVLLLVNKQSQASLQVANTFAAVRQIPQCNIVYLDLPASVYGGTATISPEQYTQLIWQPANTIAKERGLDHQILAWVYSVDFPIRVKTDASDRRQMSVGGLTLLRNRIPDLTLVEEGKYQSKLFAGPNDRLQYDLPSLSLGMYRTGLGEQVTVPDGLAYLKDGLGDEIPLPSMMLGYVGEKGNDVQTVLDTILRGVGSDYRGRREGIYFVTSEDVRSTCREWQYEPVVKALQARGISAAETNAMPAGAMNVMGLLMGAEKVDPSTIGSFAPGAMAEHLTSWSAEFQRPQTKATAWLKAGATASAGSVVEPYSNPNKFPSARFFVHYTAGCSMLESLYQSIACPLQQLLLGDPLAKPYAPRIGLKVLGAETITADFTYAAQAESPVSNAKFLYAFYVDGKPIRGFSEEMTTVVPAHELADGYHELRAVACMQHMVQYHGLADKGFMVNIHGRSVSIRPEIEKKGPYEHALKVKLEGDDEPERIRLACGGLVLDEKPYSADVELILDEKAVGEGPVRIQAVAIYPDGMEVASRPLEATIAFAP